MTAAGPCLGVVVVAAGRSSRMGGQDKLFARLGGQPVLAHTLTRLAAHPLVAALVVVAAPERHGDVSALVEHLALPRIVAVVPGGARRQDSVRAGVLALPETDVVAIHDGARPFVEAAMLARGLAALATADAAIAVVPVNDTIKQVDPRGTVLATPPRAGLRAAQTPQLFRTATLTTAYATVDWSIEFTDEATMVERLGCAVTTFSGAPTNVKVTTPTDLVVAEALLAAGLVPGA